MLTQWDFPPTLKGLKPGSCDLSVPLVDDTCNGLHLGPGLPALESEGKLQTPQNLYDYWSEWIAPVRLMTVGLQVTSCSALQSYIWQKGKGKKQSAHYFPVRNSRRDKNISEILISYILMVFVFIYINGLAELNQGFWVRNVSKMNWKASLMWVMLHWQNGLNSAYWFNGKS